jgi:hypothetical protein
MPNPNKQNDSTSSKTAEGAHWRKPVGTCLGILLILVGFSLISSSFDDTPSDVPHRDFLTGAAMLGGAIGAFGLAWKWFDPQTQEVKLGIFYGATVVLAAFIALFMLHFGMFQIGGYDHGYMVDVAWRLCHGQQLYKDFPCTTPISFVLGSKFAMQWFGNSWRSFVIIMALFSVVSFVWSVFLLGTLFGRNWMTLLWAVTIQVISPMMPSFWTYNSTADLIGLIFVLSALYWFRRPDSKAALASYGLSLAVLATMKPNIAGTLIPGISAIMFFSSKHRWKVLAVSVVAFGLFFLFLAVNHASLSAMIMSYVGVSHRASALASFFHYFSPLEIYMSMLALVVVLLPAAFIVSQGRQATCPSLAWLPALAMIAGIFIVAPNKESKVVVETVVLVPVLVALVIGWKSLGSLSVWIPIVALLSSLYGFITNSEQKLVDLPPVLIAVLLLASEMRSAAVTTGNQNAILQVPAGWVRYFAVICLVLGGVGLAQGVGRDRVQGIGPFYERDNSHTIADGFFKGVRCGRLFDEVLRETTYVIQQYPNASVWFGPRMQWGYPAYDKPSPANEPIQWDQSMFDPAKEEMYFNTFLQSRRQLLICFKNDVSNYSREEVQQILQNYDVDQSLPVLTVFRLKGYSEAQGAPRPTQ